MKVLVTGAKGMLGSDLCPILKENGFDVVEVDIEDMNIVNFEEVNKVLKAKKPDIVVHCAAYTDVDGAEKEFEYAREINSKGTENIARVCAEINATMVYISTDYVFDGQKNEPYKPIDIPNPINNYGLTKLEGEIAVKKYCTKYYIARTSWLYGLNGKNFVETMLSLKDKPELKVVDDQKGCPTWTNELSKGIVKLLNGMPYGTYHICGCSETTWYNFARKIFEFENLKVNLKPCKTDEFPRLAKRPKYSVMQNQGFCREWSEALKDYLKIRREK